MSGPSENGIQLEAIDSAANFAESIAESRTDEQRIEALEQKLAAIEPLLEAIQKHNATSTALSFYINDLRDEQKFFNIARIVLAIGAGFIVLFLVYLLWESVWNAKSPLLKAPAPAIAAYVLGLVSGVVFLVAGFTRGVFRSTAERHADGFLPPALQTSIELYDKVMGKN